MVWGFTSVFSKHLGFCDIDEVKNRNAHSSLCCAWHSFLEPKETLKAGQKVMILGSNIAFILIQWRYFSKGYFFSLSLSRSLSLSLVYS